MVELAVWVSVRVVGVKNVPPTLRVPTPLNVIVALALLPLEEVMFLVTMAVPSTIVMRCLPLPLPAFENTRSSVENVPLPTAKVLILLLPFEARGIVVVALTVSVTPALMLSVVADEPPDAPMVRLAAVAAAVTVTVEPLVMVTSSLLPGTTPPVQVAGEFQLPPVAVEEIDAASASCGCANAAMAKSRASIKNALLYEKRRGKVCPNMKIARRPKSLHEGKLELASIY